MVAVVTGRALQWYFLQHSPDILYFLLLHLPFVFSFLLHCTQRPLFTMELHLTKTYSYKYFKVFKQCFLDPESIRIQSDLCTRSMIRKAKIAVPRKENFKKFMFEFKTWMLSLKGWKFSRSFRGDLLSIFYTFGLQNLHPRFLKWLDPDSV